MKIKKRSAVSLLLIAALILSLSAFMSCNKSETPVDIMIHMKITSSAGENLYDGDLQLSGLPTEFNVLMATQKMCVDVLEIDFEYDKDLDAVKRIGADVSELFENDEVVTEENADADVEDEAGDEEVVTDEVVEDPAEADETETNPENVIKDFYYDWICTINGVEATISTSVKAGDNIQWVWKEVKKSLVDEKK